MMKGTVCGPEAKGRLCVDFGDGKSISYYNSWLTLCYIIEDWCVSSAYFFPSRGENFPSRKSGGVIFPSGKSQRENLPFWFSLRWVWGTKNASGMSKLIEMKHRTYFFLSAAHINESHLSFIVYNVTKSRPKGAKIVGIFSPREKITVILNSVWFGWV